MKTAALEITSAGLLAGFAWYCWHPAVLLVAAVFVGLVAWRRETK